MSLRTLVLILFLGLLPSCTIVRIDGSEGPPGFEFDGVVEGHAAVGWLENDTPLEIKVFEGSQSASLFELEIWKILRFELGLAGASISLGPLHLGLGVLGYEARRPALIYDDEEWETEVEDHDELEE